MGVAGRLRLSSFSLPAHIYNFHHDFTRRSATQSYRVHGQTSYGSSTRFEEHFRLSTSDFEAVVVLESRADILREGTGSIVLR